MLLSEYICTFQIFLHHLNNNVGMFGMHFVPSKCGVLLKGWFGAKPNRVFKNDVFDEVDKFCYVDGYISLGLLLLRYNPSMFRLIR